MKPANGKLAVALRTMKRTCDNVAGELRILTSESIPKMSEKGYPPQMQEFYSAKIEEVGKVVKEAREHYATTIVAPDITNIDDLDSLLGDIKKVDRMTADMESMHKDFNKAHAVDLKRMTA